MQGLFNLKSALFTVSVIGGVARKAYIKMMEQEAQQAAQIGRPSIIVQDNGLIHRLRQVQQLWSKWEKQGLYIFLLPKDCSQMNQIKWKWQQLKKDELAGEMFEAELDLAYAVIQGVEVRGETSFKKEGKCRPVLPTLRS